jgi:DNA-binding cell septation regulator SpoVG
MSVVILNWTPRTSGTLRGHLSLRLPSGLVLHEVSVHHRDGNWWLAMPARPMLQDGNALRDHAGKVRYAPPVVGFASAEIRSRFTSQVLEALRQTQPELFAAEAVA